MPDRCRSRRTRAQVAGDEAEALVAERLAALGWAILARNVRLGRLEVDLIALDPGPPAAVVVVEVRWRASREFGLVEETFDYRKRAHLRAAVGRLLDAHRLPDGRPLPSRILRVDLVVVEPAARGVPDVRLRHHRNALDR